jgi:hypothetical protein
MLNISSAICPIVPFVLKLFKSQKCIVPFQLPAISVVYLTYTVLIIKLFDIIFECFQLFYLYQILIVESILPEIILSFQNTAHNTHSLCFPIIMLFIGLLISHSLTL